MLSHALPEGQRRPALTGDGLAPIRPKPILWSAFRQASPIPRSERHCLRPDDIQPQSCDCCCVHARETGRDYWKGALRSCMRLGSTPSETVTVARSF